MYKILHIPTAKLVYEDRDYFAFAYSYRFGYKLDTDNMIHVNIGLNTGYCINKYRAPIYFETKDEALNFIGEQPHYKDEGTHILLGTAAVNYCLSEAKPEQFEIIEV